MEAQVNNSWALKYYMIWECVARTDNGIDDRDIKDEKIIPLTADMLVEEHGVIVGCRSDGHLFRFDNPQTHFFSEEVDRGYVGGWGDITETYCLELIRL